MQTVSRAIWKRWRARGTAREEQVAELRERNAKLKQQVADLRERSAKLKQQVADLRAQLRNARQGRDDIDPRAHNTEAGMDAFFGEIADETPYREFGQALRVKLNEHAIALDARRVIDVGTGTGLMLRELLDGATPATVKGLDFSEVALRHARVNLPDAEFRRHDIYEPIGEEFDIVLCTEVLEHLEHPGRALTVLLGALAPGGALILTVPDGRIDFSRYHVNFWSPESWRLFVADAAAGLDVSFDRFSVRDSASYQNNLAIVRCPD